MSVVAVAWLTPISAPISTPMALIVATIASVSGQCHTLPNTPMKVAIAGKAIRPAHLRISYALLGRKYVLSSIGFPCQCLPITMMIIRVTQIMLVIVIAVISCPFLVFILICEMHDGFSLGYFHVCLCPMHFVPRSLNVAIEFAVL